MLILDDPMRAFMPYPPIAVAGAASGPLAGLTLGVKDLFDVKGYRTGCGSPVKLAQSPVAIANAPAVQSLLDAGARFVGKTHTEELAWSLYGTNVHFGTPINPAAPGRVPGGSSSGSASAVAASLCDIALGSDTGGSVRAPASFCGIYGLRPTHGAISLDAAMPLAPSLDTCGFFARDAATMARLGDVLLPKGEDAPITRLLMAEDLFSALLPRMRAVLEPMLARFRAHMGKAVPVMVYPGTFAPVYEAFRHIQASEALEIHGDWQEKHHPPLAPAIAARFVYARTVTIDDVAMARNIRVAFSAHLRAVLVPGSVMIAPVVPGPAPRLDASEAELDAFRHEAMRFLCPSGLASLPQLTLPAGFHEGAPVGISLIGAKGSDRALLGLAARIEEKR